jgi:hypothetical protein
MKAKVYLGGSLMWAGEMPLAPSIGSLVMFELQSYCKSYFPGSIVQVRITDDQPPVFDMTEKPPILILDGNGFNVIHEAPTPPGQDY